MDKTTKNQEFHLILADIAMAMAIATLDAEFQCAVEATHYFPGAIREDWLTRSDDKALSQRVIALANAGGASLSNLAGPELLDKAQRFGVPIDDAVAQEIAEHFTARREAVLTYNR